jgi:hypothetical protein
VARRQLRNDWLFGFILATLMFLALAWFGNFRYENSDDMLMLKPFMGFEGGIPANFTLYTHTLLAWLLYGLSLAVPGVAWFSVYQLALLYFSAVVLGKSMAQLAQARRYPWLACGLAAAVMLSVFAAFACCRVSYTSTAGLAGAAAVAQQLTAGQSGYTNRQRLRAYGLSLFLLVCAYCLRAVSVLPTLAFSALVFLWQWRSRREQPARYFRPLLIALALYVGVFGALAGIRQAEISLRGLQPYIDWQNARIALMDYTDFQTDPAPALAANSGLSASEVELVRQWYFLSSDIDTEALHTMAAAYPSLSTADALGRLLAFFSQNPRYTAMAVLLTLLTALCWLGDRKNAPLTAAAATLAWLGAGLLLLYLGLRGRLIGRGVDTVLMPCAAVLFGFQLLQKPPAGRVRRAALLAMVCLSVVVSGYALRITAHAVTRRQDTTSQQREAELETYALQNPDLLVVRDTALLRDTRLFPSVSAGLPTNIALWGDWGCRTPSWNRQLALLGLDADHLTATDWVSDRIIFAAADPSGTADLLAYLTDALGSPVEAVPCGESGTLRFYRFQLT